MIVENGTHSISELSIISQAGRFGVESPRCGNCQHFRREYDGEFCENECGTYCTLRDPDLEGNGDHGAGGLCGLWTPDFWQTKFAVDARDSEFGEGTEQFETAVKDYLAAFREAL